MEEVIMELRNLERTHLFGHSERELRLSVRDAIATAQQLTHAQGETEDDWTDEDDQAFVQLREDLEDIRRALDRYLRSVRLGRFRRLSVPRA